MKYIRTINDEGRLEIFTFPSNIDHDCMAESINRIRILLRGRWERLDRHPVSAGFVVNGKCCGRSESLGLDSEPDDDTQLLNEQMERK